MLNVKKHRDVFSPRYFDDGKELVAQIHDKQQELPDDVGEDFSKAESFHRMHAAFERDITALGKQVGQGEGQAERRTLIIDVWGEDRAATRGKPKL